jgi:hypothetical protein
MLPMVDSKRDIQILKAMWVYIDDILRVQQ